MIIAICCTDLHWGIGKNNGLLFRLKGDMELFKQTTINSIVVMGENTLLSFPKQKPLPHRVNIVLCPEGHEYEDCICIHDFEQLVKVVKILSTEFNVFIVGGGMMYKSMLPYCDRVIVNKVEAVDDEATVFFPNLDLDARFEVKKRFDIVEDSGYKTKLYIYQKRQNRNNIV